MGDITTSSDKIEDLSRDELLELVKIYAKNWLAHDGCWFLAMEEKYGMAEAIEIDSKSWERFTVIEAKRLISFLQLKNYEPIEALRRALAFRLYATLNKDEIIIDGNSLTYKVKTCRVQSARERKGLDNFPCKPVGIIEYGLFAKTINENFETECISCPPDRTTHEAHCIWKFTLKS